MFEKADADGNGTLDQEEVKGIISSLAGDLGLNRIGDVDYVVGQVMAAAAAKWPKSATLRTRCVSGFFALWRSWR